VLVLAGMVMVATTMAQRATADAMFGIYALVPGPVPHTSAIISTPAANTTSQSSDTLVGGSCPIITPQVTVVLTMDGTLAGSAVCDPNNDFALPISLSPGAHTLVAKTYTSTSGQGPDSQPVQIAYQPARAAPQPAAVMLSPAAPFTILSANRTATWDGAVSGGTAPYHVLVDWGDGKRDNYTVTADAQHFTHHYAVLQSYNARVAASDTTGQSVQQQYAESYTSLAATPAITLASTTTPSPSVVAGLYGMFLTVLSVACIFWVESKHAARHETATT